MAALSVSHANAAMPFSPTTRRRLLIVFFVVLMLPIQPVLGGQRLDPYRFLMLVLFLPFIVAMLTGRAGRFTSSDGLMLCYALWTVITLVYHHGMERFAYASIVAAMMLGGYMSGRLLIRSAEDYGRFIRYFLILLLILLPFTVFELFTERMIFTEVLGKVFPATAQQFQTRNGLSRVQVVFPHSILFGLFCSMAFGNVIYIYRHLFFGRLVRLGLVVGMTFMALSSAPLLSIGLQSIMTGWDKITRGRWMILILGIVSVYIFLSLASNRGPVIILIEKMTFDPSTAWWRVYIWEYGSQNVAAHPIVGLGLNDWARPTWLAATVDNFWLLTAMQAGIPALAFLVAALALNVFHIVRAKNLTAEARNMRTGYLVVLAGTAFTLSTVHVWDAMAVFMMFYFGAGSFLFTAPPQDEPGSAENILPQQSPRGKTTGRVAAPVIYARTDLAQTTRRQVQETPIRQTAPSYTRKSPGPREMASMPLRPALPEKP